MHAYGFAVAVFYRHNWSHEEDAIVFVQRPHTGVIVLNGSCKCGMLQVA